MISADGPSVQYLEERQADSRPVWTQTTHWLQLGQMLASIYFGILLMRAMWQIGRARYIGKPPERINLFAETPSRIHGWVFEDIDGDGIADEDDKGIPGVAVFLDVDGDGRGDRLAVRKMLELGPELDVPEPRLTLRSRAHAPHAHIDDSACGQRRWITD